MIFISHQHNDKEFVGGIAQSLEEIYGKDKVFYDKWSIKPGENILTRMSEGIEECKYFFYFITENSLKSDMVTLEWTSALKERNKRGIQFIPVRADNVDVPAIIRAISYIDLYTHGLDTAITEMKEIIEGETEKKEHTPFRNLHSYILQENEANIKYFVTSKRFFEPSSNFILLTTYNEDEADFGISGTGMFSHYFIPNATVIDNKQLNGFVVKLSGGIHKGSFIGLHFMKKVERDGIARLAHLKTDTYFEAIPSDFIQSTNELPF